jgi:hypothetical protein
VVNPYRYNNIFDVRQTGQLGVMLTLRTGTCGAPDFNPDGVNRYSLMIFMDFLSLFW